VRLSIVAHLLRTMYTTADQNWSRYTFSNCPFSQRLASPEKTGSTRSSAVFLRICQGERHWPIRTQYPVTDREGAVGEGLTGCPCKLALQKENWGYLWTIFFNHTWTFNWK